MKKLLRRLWHEEHGFVLSSESIVTLSMLACAVVVSAAALRTVVIEELADLGDSVSSFDQSYQLSGLQGHAAASHGSSFDDQFDFCDNRSCIQPTAGTGRCITQFP
jgi:hypothetical protein